MNQPPCITFLFCIYSKNLKAISRGEDYNTAESVYQIGFLDFTLFENHPEFFANYQMRNSKDNFLYTDKFNLFVVELNHTDIATDEDKLYGIDTWAKLFKATTWAEIKMITEKNPSMNSTAEAIFVSTANEDILEHAAGKKTLLLMKNIKLNKLKH